MKKSGRKQLWKTLLKVNEKQIPWNITYLECYISEAVPWKHSAKSFSETFRHIKIKKPLVHFIINFFLDIKWMQDTLWLSYIYLLSKIYFLWYNGLKAFLFWCGNFRKFTGKHLVMDPIFNKIAGLQPATLKKRNQHRYFNVNFATSLGRSF